MSLARDAAANTRRSLMDTIRFGFLISHFNHKSFVEINLVVLYTVAIDC